ncbi:MAG: hypothetical protein J07HB67_00466, partial [halophilic archaeon J07HB67]
SIVEDVLGGKNTMSLPNAKAAGREQVEQLQLAVTDTANSYLRDQITERVNERIEEDF